MLDAAERSQYRGTAERLGFERAVRVVESLEPTIAREFARTTDVLLRDVKLSPQGDGAWSGGLLNRTGAPLEFSFGACSPDLRYTVEAGDPQTPPGRRLDIVEILLEELGAPRSEDGVCTRFREIQQGADVQFGAWLGVRHRRGERATSFKIYSEVPGNAGPTASALVSKYLGRAPVRPASQLVLLGGEAGGERCEFYFEIAGRQILLETVRGMLARVGLESQEPELVGLIRSFDFRRAGENGELPQAQYGFSYSVLPGGAEPAFSIFVFAPDLAGGDGLIRRQMLASALSRGWTLGCYAAITEPVGQHYFRSAYHNIISFAASRDSVGFQVSVCPPPDLQEED